MKLSKYFRPIMNTGRIYPTDAIFLGSTSLWFNAVKVFERGKVPIVVNAKEIPFEIKSGLSVNRGKILGFEKKPPLLMGVLNVSPDSFSDGYQARDPSDLLKRINKMVDEGVDIIDIGGESTRPGFTSISSEAEKKRVDEAIRLVRKNFPNLLMSIDTRKASVAEHALSLGVKILNDVSSLSFDPDSIEIAKKFGSFVCIMHNSGAGKDLHKRIMGKDFLLDIFDYLRERIEFAVSGGISRSKIIIDPGIGFGKTEEQNLAILSNISLFHSLACPILVGVSRKKFIGRITGENKPEDRLVGSVLAAGELAKQGVQIVRVHDIKETNQVMNILYKLRTAD
ncbi:MAG: dihydropteroate synthase [Paracoccaceae bacterium]|nr:dihydropteroate synthase [Paracoccaceae bacterium]